jgi:hypothetical protein
VAPTPTPMSEPPWPSEGVAGAECLGRRWGCMRCPGRVGLVPRVHFKTATADDRSAEAAVCPSPRGDQHTRPGFAWPGNDKDGKP